MPIGKGEPWGIRSPLPADGVVVGSDADANAVVTRARRAGEAIPPLGLIGGDLARTVGATGDEARLRSSEAMRLPCDLGEVLVDGVLAFFVAHLVVRQSWLFGDLDLVMNAEFLGSADVVPRSHPNDGRLDHVHITMPPTERLEARRRARTGAHLPHPGIAVSRTAMVDLDVRRGARVYLDGVSIGRPSRLAIRCRPDAFVVHI